MAGPDRIRADYAVLGSGPGGSLTACLLAEAGRDVVLLEEGPSLPPHLPPSFTREEMEQKYRGGGLTVALGRTKVAYVEGCCVGGGSEINSGLYHRTPADVLDEWRRQFRTAALTEDDLRPHFEANEHDLSVTARPGPAPGASQRLHDGAARLGWQSLEVPRWVSYAPGGPPEGVRQTMTRTFIPRALAAGARLLPQTRARRLVRHGERWAVHADFQDATGRRRLVVEAVRVVVACGATQTPALLRRSGVARSAGARLHLHPTVKVVAEFAEEVNAPGMGVPAHQVKEFAPRYSFGCSVSTPPHLSLALLDHPQALAALSGRWRHMAVYYAMTRGGCGRVRTLPGWRDPLVSYRLDRAELAELGAALRRLCECLLAAGAVALYPVVGGAPIVRSTAELELLPASLPPGRTNLMTVHLFSSCPLGEAAECVADSFGRVRVAEGLWIADASLLPGPPGVNPQGTLMAIARRNVLHLLGSLK